LGSGGTVRTAVVCPSELEWNLCNGYVSYIFIRLLLLRNSVSCKTLRVT